MSSNWQTNLHFLEKKLPFSAFILVSILLWGACQSKNSKQENILPSKNKDIVLADSFFLVKELDSAKIYNEKALTSLPTKPSAERAERWNLQTRILYFKQNPDYQRYLDSVGNYILQTKSSPSLSYVQYLNNKGLAYMRIKNDSARHFFALSLAQNKKLPALDNEELHRSLLNTGLSFIYENKPDSANILFQQAENEYNKLPNPHPMSQFSIYNFLGYVNLPRQNEVEAEKYYQKALSILQKNYPNFKNIGDSYLNLALAKWRQVKLASTLDLLEEGVQVAEKQQNIPHLVAMYRFMGNILRNQGETALALEYLQKATALQQQNAVPASVIDPYLRLNVYNDMALAYMDEKKYPDALHAMRQALQHYETKGANFEIATAYLNMGIIHYFAQKYDSAAYFTQKALAQQAIPETDVSFPMALHWHGAVLAKQKKFAAAATYLNDAQLSLAQNHRAQGFEASELWETWAELYQQEGRDSAVLAAHQKAIQAVLYDFRAEKINENPALKGIISPKHLLQALTAKADFLYLQATHNQDNNALKLSLSTYELAQALVDTIRLNYQSTNSKLSLMGELLPVYEHSIRTAIALHKQTNELQYLEKAFLFAERNKATLLQESLQSLKGSYKAGVPDSLLHQLSDLQSEIGYWENKKYQNPDISDSLQLHIFATKEKYQHLKQKLEEAYPDYYRSRFEIQSPTLAEIRSKLATEKRSLVEFFVGDSTAYIFYVGQKNLLVHSLAADSVLTQEIITLRRLLSEREFMKTPKESFSDFVKTAFSLYQKLYQPFEKQIDTEEVLIIPDGILAYIPFEVLIQKTVPENKINYLSLPYLLKEKSISYAYSGSIWLHPLPANLASSKSCVAFAPVFEGESKGLISRGEVDAPRQGLAALTQTREEVKQIAKQTGGDVFLENEATETHFKAISADYNVIHLATHTLINDESPLDLKLVFAAEKGENDGYLYLYELYGMRLNAQMAVLSACNTGYGRLQRGEGVMSLARGFAQAGVPSVVMSLWTAQDQSTSQIMASFYEHLSKGETKDAALRHAKLAYLDNTQKIASHPYFWSAFVVLGDIEPIAFAPYRKYKIGAGIIFGILVLAALFLRYRFSQKKNADKH